MDPSLTLADATAHDTFASVQEDIDATTAELINASIRSAAQAHAAATAQAQAEADAEAEALEAAASSVQAPGDFSSSTFDRPSPAAAAGLDEGLARDTGEGSSTPAPSLFPYPRPQRDETTDYPLELDFATKDEFDTWLQSESSWCHYVQRRVTNPEKRSEERLRAREKAHEKMLEAMTPEERALERPLKKRRRNRTSTVLNKVTYTCHHAGKYESQHNTELPQEKLRMNTKTSVKCGCSSRVVMNEQEGGEVKAAFYWKHTGHDPFADKEAETYRLPTIVSDWLLAQFAKGKEPEDILKLLNIAEEDKAERIRLATVIEQQQDNDVIVNGDDPPAIAYSLQIKYPDLYNRYRKVGPPLRHKKGGVLPLESGEGSVTDTPELRTPAEVGKVKKEPLKRGRKRKAEAETVAATKGITQTANSSTIDGNGGTASNDLASGQAQVPDGSTTTGADTAQAVGGISDALQDHIANALDGVPPDAENDAHDALFLDGVEADDFTFADLDENLHHLHPDVLAYPPAPLAAGLAAQSSSGAAEGLPIDIDPALTAHHVADTALADEWKEEADDDTMGLLDEEETTRMTEELEKLANEITSTWRQ